jgi:hypothetical protein
MIMNSYVFILLNFVLGSLILSVWLLQFVTVICLSDTVTSYRNLFFSVDGKTHCTLNHGTY